MYDHRRITDILCKYTREIYISSVYDELFNDDPYKNTVSGVVVSVDEIPVVDIISNRFMLIVKSLGILGFVRMLL